MPDGTIYLDHHATTPCDPAVFDAMRPWFTERFGNAASRSHAFGWEARRAVEQARGQVAAWLGASPKEVVFTSGATEANNLALFGLVRARGGGHVVTVATEHPAVLDPVAALARQGVATTVLPVSAEGLVDPEDVARALRPDTVVVSVMRVNSEIGVMQPLAEIAAVCREHGVRVHTDAAQSVAVPMGRDELGVDLISVSGHKLYGPKGIGALVVRRTRPKIELEPLLYGGGHERGMRSGTVPVPLVVGLGAAAERVALGHAVGEPERLASLRDRLLVGLQERVPGVIVNGSLVRRAPNNLHVSFEGVQADALLVAVRDVVALSTGSACASESTKPSHVLEALGLGAERASSSVRFGLGRSTTVEQIDRVVDALAAQVATLRC